MADLTDQEIRVLILTRLAVDLWPVAGRALGLGRDAASGQARGDPDAALQGQEETGPDVVSEEITQDGNRAARLTKGAAPLR